MILDVSVSESTKTFIYTTEASASPQLASSKSDTLTMDVMPLATSSTSTVVGISKWVKSILNMTEHASEALNMT